MKSNYYVQKYKGKWIIMDSRDFSCDFGTMIRQMQYAERFDTREEAEARCPCFEKEDGDE